MSFSCNYRTETLPETYTMPSIYFLLFVFSLMREGRTFLHFLMHWSRLFWAMWGLQRRWWNTEQLGSFSFTYLQLRFHEPPLWSTDLSLLFAAAFLFAFFWWWCRRSFFISLDLQPYAAPNCLLTHFAPHTFPSTLRWLDSLWPFLQLRAWSLKCGAAESIWTLERLKEVINKMCGGNKY